MTLEQLASLSQIIGVFAVFGSLVFVGLQMRAQTRESRLAAVQELCSEYREMMMPAITSKELGRAWLQAVRHGLGSLTEEEATRVAVLVQQYLRTFESLYIQHRAGRLDDDLWQAIKTQMAAFMSTSPFRDLWKSRAQFYTPRFQALVNSLPAVTYPIVTEQETPKAMEPQP